MRLARWLIGVVVAAPLAASASWFNTQFSAETYQTQPNQPPQSGKLYVGKARMRSEMTHQNQTAIQILDPEQQRGYLIFPEQQAYMEQTFSGAMGATGGHESDPCAGMTGVQCHNLGQETLNGRMAVKWEMVGEASGQPVRALQWNDADHGFPVRGEQNGKVMFELRYLGDESVNGRQTEKWEFSRSGSGGAQITMTRWYDPRLNNAVREEMAGGYVRELRNIQEGPQPDALFTVPEGYRKIDPPAGQFRPQGGALP